MIIRSPGDFRNASDPAIFLAGSIDMGDAEDWQARAAAALDRPGWIVLNPRRANWDASWRQSKDVPQFKAQVEWELEGLSTAVLKLFYFHPGTQSPIALLELGRSATQDCIVCCPDGFWRKGNVDIACQRWGLRQVGTLDELIAAAADWMREYDAQPNRSESGNLARVFKGKHLRMMRRGRWEYAERVKASGAAVIVAVTPDNKVLLTEQFRIPVNRRVIEFPAGLAGDSAETSGEPFADAARRELLEETGYEAQQMVHLTTGPSSAGLTSELISIFHATGLRRVNAGGGVEGEQIVVHEIPLSEIARWLNDRQNSGCLIDPKVFAGLWFISGAK